MQLQLHRQLEAAVPRSIGPKTVPARSVPVCKPATIRHSSTAAATGHTGHARQCDDEFQALPLSLSVAELISGRSPGRPRCYRRRAGDLAGQLGAHHGLNLLHGLSFDLLLHLGIRNFHIAVLSRRYNRSAVCQAAARRPSHEHGPCNAPRQRQLQIPTRSPITNVGTRITRAAASGFHARRCPTHCWSWAYTRLSVVPARGRRRS